MRYNIYIALARSCPGLVNKELFVIIAYSYYTLKY